MKFHEPLVCEGVLLSPLSEAKQVTWQENWFALPLVGTPLPLFET